MDLCVPTSGSGQMKCVVILTENPQNVQYTSSPCRITKDELTPIYHDAQ